MNNELLTILNYMERDRGIDREVLLQAVEFALQSAARKNLGTENVRIHIDRKTCDIKAFAPAEVVGTLRPAKGQVSLKDAQAISPDAKVGDSIEIEVTPTNLGRIAAQTAKQAILQKIRQAERDIVFTEYKDRIKDIVSGTVKSFNRRDIIIDLGRAEAMIPAKERVPTEEYQVGDRVRAYVLEVQSNPMGGPAIILSRADPGFVSKLFELEVSEIADGIVQIKGIAREPGYRTKIAVFSKDEKVDPVGACVGMRGMRVKNIVRELSGEKIDIIRWSDDPRQYVINALSPAKLHKVVINPNDPLMVHVSADPEQLSLAIGKGGQNVRLTARLLGMKIDIQKEEVQVSFEEKVAKAVESLAAIPGIERETAEALVRAGFLTVEGILAADVNDIAENAGIGVETAQSAYKAAAAVNAQA